jgi:hypothetical protein
MRTLLGCALVLSAACSGGTSDDGATVMGQQQLPGYRIDVTPTLSLDAEGFGVTATNVGHFRIVWVGATSDVLEGTLTTDGDFDPPSTSPLGGKELIANQAGMIQFKLSPTADLNGLDFVTSSGPVYLDLVRNADRAATEIAFLRQGERRLSAHNPVAIDANVTR